MGNCPPVFRCPLPEIPTPSSTDVRCFYSPDYDLPLPDGHPFPMRKFTDAHRFLLAAKIVRPTDITLVDPTPRPLIERIHHPTYLDNLIADRFSSRERTVLGLPPGPALFERSAREVEGTRLAAHAALADGVAANLAGGTHHAFPDHGEGFCVLNDVAITIADLHTRQPNLRIFVCDTDAHQGNGTHAIFTKDDHVFTYSIHVGANYPSRKSPGDLDVPLQRFANGDTFLSALRQSLPDAVESFRPDLAIWISGADPHRNDRFGQLQLSAREMTLRDEFVGHLFVDQQIPLTVLYGGGYNREVENTARLHRNTIATAARLR
ncbi:MAG: histone deacetylase [Chthoniobacterales bacterium]